MAEEFDYVIVGGGAAGCVLAARLAERPGVTVCLLEAGPGDRDPWLHIPAGFIKVVFGTRYTWGFQTEPGPHIDGRRLSAIQGRVLGGSASINGMIYVRGQAKDFDSWAAGGNPGWSYADVLPYFRKTERRVGIADDDQYRGGLGAIPVTDLQWREQTVDTFVSAAGQVGIPFNPDYNGARQDGSGRYQYTIERGWRQNALKRLLRPAQRSGRIDVRTNAPATRILLDGRRAAGVEYRRHGQQMQVRAQHEVVLCAGVINTPKLLQLSGIGDPAHLADIGVPAQQALPGVGLNLRDHYAARMVYRSRGVTTINELTRGPRLLGQIARWLAGRPNVLSFGLVLGNVFWKSRPDLDRPDIVITFTPASFAEGLTGKLDAFPGFTVGVWQLRPNSHGYVRIVSPDPSVPPAIQPNYLAEESDKQVLVGGMKLARSIMAAPAMARMVESETTPGPATQSDEDLLSYARAGGHGTYHLVGSTRMGPRSDPTAVVDAQLRVYGIDGLRVADASVMPSMVSANTMAATMMIAEKAADLISEPEHR
ncbi:GMC family oxidoreductase N-terminal domain-containing protein [Aquamicrobium sp. LC103]|uniref:GMC family oxidoreductase n=1 Tax=Aquamicrobium sp. LC103 TaxID=1120658 RepID=UPI00063ED1AD|nr:GMC family oxidoreductase N-terminal domain-containing protein [Aquamicrobium sp. LC103]TKT74484.1 choline dehydrogenase [Aquamicrobium sp. LC103]